MYFRCMLRVLDLVTLFLNESSEEKITMHLANQKFKEGFSITAYSQILKF